MGYLLGYALHLVAGVIWAGGVLYTALVVFPALARLPAGQAEAMLARMGWRSGAVMGAAGLLVLLTGPLRAWLSGGVQSLGDLATPYGMIVVAAFVLVFAVQGVDGAFRQRLRRLMADPAAFAAKAPGLARRNAILAGGGIGLVLALMVMLGTGAY